MITNTILRYLKARVNITFKKNDSVIKMYICVQLLLNHIL
jgi:hypothetical protein